MIALFPKGDLPHSPGLRGTSYPGEAVGYQFNPIGVVSVFRADLPRHNPVGVGCITAAFPG
jgi:hypothetical protein